MRVVYLNPCGQLGGAETSLREILSSLRRAAPEWDLRLVLGEDGPFAAEARQRGVPVIVEPFPPKLARLGDARRQPLRTVANLVGAVFQTLQYRRRLARILRTLEPGIIHTNGFKMHLLGAWSRPPGTPLVWHIHDYVGTRPLMSRLLRMFHRPAAMAIVNSKSVGEDLRTLLPGKRIVPIANAIDLERFSAAGTKLDLDEIAGLPPAAPGIVRVGLVGTFARWKGHKIFLQALGELASKAPVRGYIIGGPIYQTAESQWSLEELQLEVDRLGLRGQVGFTGFLGDIPAVMRSLDIVVHASTLPEPFGMVIIEAMACGRAVIASQAGGAAELFSDGENALAHAPGDASALADQMVRLANDKELRDRLGKAGRATAQRSYGAERLAVELLAVYREIGEGSGEPGAESVARSSLRAAGD